MFTELKNKSKVIKLENAIYLERLVKNHFSIVYDEQENEFKEEEEFD